MLVDYITYIIFFYFFSNFPNNNVGRVMKNKTL